jgi:pimeloyl-ACP methyl ester carboxylesterase
MSELVTIGGGLTAVAVAAGVDVADPPGGAVRPPVLFVHGMMAAAWIFERYQRFFAARGYASWAVNLRGHAGSRPVPRLGRVSMSEYVDDVGEAARALADAYGVERPVVLGHSMGGLLAQKLAERGAVAAAVLLCSAPPRGISVTSLTLLRYQLSYAWPIVRGAPIVGSRAGFDALNFNRVPADERAALYARFVPESGRVGRELSLGGVAVDVEHVRCPLLVCAATDDRLVPARVAGRIAKLYGARADYLEFADHGHLVLLEPGWEQPAGAIVRWLDAAVGS